MSDEISTEDKTFIKTLLGQGKYCRYDAALHEEPETFDPREDHAKDEEMSVVSGSG